MEKITGEWKFGEVLNLPELKEVKPYLLYFGENEMPPYVAETAIKDVDKIGWSSKGIVRGCNFLLEQLAKEGEIRFAYTAEECTEDARKKDVNIMRFVPEKTDESKPYIILIAGGGMTCVCTLAESIPTARHFVEAGYQVFTITYRVGRPGVKKLSMDDLAACVTYIRNHAEEFQVNPDNYAIGGFSAGSGLAALWGSKEMGYAKYGEAKPQVIFPVYGVSNLKNLYGEDAKEGYMNLILGEDQSEENFRRFNVIDQVNAEYPPCYVVCGKDDVTVPPTNSEELYNQLNKYEIPAKLEKADGAAHGFGDGEGTGAEGWPERAIAFMESVRN